MLPLGSTQHCMVNELTVKYCVPLYRIFTVQVAVGFVARIAQRREQL